MQLFQSTTGGGFLCKEFAEWFLATAFVPPQVKRSRSLGYVAPAKHPAPFDTRVVAGSLPQYEKVVHKATDESFLDTMAKHPN